MTPFSLIVITLNEESNIERCLRSVPFATDVVVLDSHSTDRTVQLAKDCGARVFSEDFRGYAAQKQRAIELAKHEWILWLDADEALSPEASEELKQVLSGDLRPEHCPAYRLPRRSYHLGRWIQHGGWYPDRGVRLFHRTHMRWNSSRVHEAVLVDRWQDLQNPILHWVFTDLTDQIETNNRYSSLGAEDLETRGVRFSFLKLILKPWSKFIETYIWKRGFLDGMPGFIISVGAAYSVFLKFAKLWELQSLNQQKRSVKSATK